MENSKITGVVCAGRPAFLPEIERELLSHVDMCYSVALALTRDPLLGQRLARATLLWAWQRQAKGKDLDAGGVKMALLKNLRGRYLHDFYPACSRDFRPAAVVFSEKGAPALCAAGTPGHAETCAGG